MNTSAHDPSAILHTLDRCCNNSTFPMLDNGYVYLAATRLSLHRSSDHWAMVFETFGYSPREELPGLQVQTFASLLHNRNKAENYVTPEAHQSYLKYNPNNESRFFYPLAEGDWIAQDEPEAVARSGTALLRDIPVPLPSLDQYSSIGIELQNENRPWIFEFCRYLGHEYRDQVLANESERRVSIPPDLTEILVLDDWRHPDVASGERPSDTETFRMLAEVLATGDISRYNTTEPPNTHWRNWPEGGTL